MCVCVFLMYSYVPMQYCSRTRRRIGVLCLSVPRPSLLYHTLEIGARDKLDGCLLMTRIYRGKSPNDAMNEVCAPEIPTIIPSAPQTPATHIHYPKHPSSIMPSRQNPPMHPLLRLLCHRGPRRLLKDHRLLSTARLRAILRPIQAERRHVVQSGVFFLFFGDRPHIGAWLAPRMWP